MNPITHVIDAIQGKHPITSKRSNKWAAIRAAHLILQPLCAVCNGKEKLQVHHKEPFHLKPELELNPDNLITLCEGSTNCHILFGHLKNFKSYNVNVVEDAAQWNKKLIERPKS